MKKFTLAAWGLGVALATTAAPALATHSWGGYHWARTSNPVRVQVGDNVDSRWDASLAGGMVDWNKSTVIESPTVSGSAGDPKRCNAVAGTIQVCNAAYGQRGWLGIASISISGGTHITQGTVKLNDSYFGATSRYNTPAWRNLVTCQEVGHTYGLDHQDENFNNANLGTCMDYTNDPSTNQHPNAHDYDQLLTIYGHLDSTTTVAFRSNAAGAFGASGDTPKEWGRAIHFDGLGRADMFERVDGPGLKTITHVFWALETPRMR